MKVRDVMAVEVLTAKSTWPIRKAWDILRDGSMHCLPVSEGDRLVGIITDRDLRVLASASSVKLAEEEYHQFLMDTMSVEQAMTPEPRTVTPDTDLKDAASLILEMRVGGLPVVEGEKLVGIITETDLVRVLKERFL
ncbi:MAG TPA: CBS domain-containing protein [Candidatus Anoxymicrobiaceae bacterium]|jgi:acetoin utilization protein AcuB